MHVFETGRRWLSDRRFFSRRAKIVPVVTLAGVIGAGQGLRPMLNLSAVNEALEKAFAKKKAVAVALVVNSPGGSPVQSALIHDRIRQLATRHDVRVLTFCEDVAASGGYWLALAGDEIYADASSIIGSIGVISAGFGFTEMIRKLGVERRVHAAGENKSFHDPFLKEDKQDLERLAALQTEIHDAFKQIVRDRRKGKLPAEPAELFTGAFWTGRKARELGLIDGIGNLHQLLRDRFGEHVKLVPMDKGGRSLARRLLGASGAVPRPENLVSGLADDILDSVESRALWRKYGVH